MILFKPYHVPLILEGRKTQTRRMGKKRWLIGSVHQAKVSYMAKPFASIKVLAIRQQPLNEMSDEDAVKEGYKNYEDYCSAFLDIYHYDGFMKACEGNGCGVLDFEIVPAQKDA